MKTPLEKRKFFDELHSQLSKKYKTSPVFISLIRSLALTHDLSREEIMDIQDEKLKNHKKKKETPKSYRQPVFDLLENMTDEAWKEITQLTKFDHDPLDN